MVSASSFMTSVSLFWSFGHIDEWSPSSIKCNVARSPSLHDCLQQIELREFVTRPLQK